MCGFDCCKYAKRPNHPLSDSTNCFCVTGVGVYISRVEENSVAEHVGLRPGDSILEVNGMPFGGVSHDEALKVRPIFCPL